VSGIPHWCSHWSWPIVFLIDYLFAWFQAAEGQRFSESERDSINVFDPHSSAFVACVLALSIFVLICFVGAALSTFVTRHLKTKKQTTELVTAPENTKSEGNNLSDLSSDFNFYRERASE